MTFSKPEYPSHPLFSFYFSGMKDPRRTNRGNLRYPLEEILFLCISAVLSGMNEWTSIVMFGGLKLEWLRQYYPYKHGIPSHDVLGKVFAALEPDEFNKCFREWINSIAELTGGEVIAIDGKTLRGSANKALLQSALHVVSAYATGNRLCLAQEVVAEKSNEITAIPVLLQMLDIKGCTVTTDAMGCQKKVAEAIIDKEADYVLMVKDNQPELKAQVEKVFRMQEATAPKAEDTDVGHGRIEQRTCIVTSELAFLDVADHWKGLKSIAKIISERTDKRSGKKTVETRYYISSLGAIPSVINQTVRCHWGIENNLHWSLDVIFREDYSLKKKGNAALNYNIIAKMALAMLEKPIGPKCSKPQKRIKAALDDEFRSRLLAG